MKIGFIGMGNMAGAMVSGMLAKGVAEPQDIMASARTVNTRESAKQKYGIRIAEDNRTVAAFGDILVLAVKPQVLSEVIGEIKDAVPEDALILSIAAGRSLAWLEKAFGSKRRLVRCMPNTPAMIGAGCSGVCRNAQVSDQEMQWCMRLIESFGTGEEIPEKLMDAVVGISGSAPAYVFLFLEALADGGVKAGMPRDQAYRFAAQTVMGSAKLMLESGLHPGVLKDMVCSPAGTTIAGVQVLEERGLRGTVMQAVEACVEKSQNM